MPPTTPFHSSAAQTTRALLSLRELILDGTLPAGARLSEVAVVQRLGMSRTPVRAALQRLCEEGLASALPGGGYAVQAFSEHDVHDAIELRGTLEGLAARMAAERGATAAQLAQAHQLLETLDAIVGAPQDAIDFAAYVQANALFHALLVAMAGSDVLGRELTRVLQLPFASPNSLVMAQTSAADAQVILTVAQDQHREVIAAITQRQGSRAEALMCEHARLAHRNLRHILQTPAAIAKVHGGALLGHAHASTAGTARHAFLPGVPHA
ncbi:GntR family transcriptional regulator [Xanthomonas vesicatoria]|uniref:GntR family transcriptional regulator n=2 Tax=Xanthomonas vesicatoria TaxID=56460 RepID=A0AAJ0N2U7_9XANT|nr:GntR family transcriptional regulator [Xanthomonas vesicatoria]APO96142.1 GntR family transcriptional regulator [Xanthomonas vesicatoria]APP76242.1 GntR family transcriptional regulator [Xanthomonas vesicatoria ATCC 35937]EGD08718.1 transcriptional regulator, GntR family [Xanthomonas vesicatoria ATCC 35937]KHM91457.1 GntR family transcriptional regulator [Xanthomonas vesicatoria]KHM91851.1 GntR family transcriptional regulator [Xanthomonas vesicatoria]